MIVWNVRPTLASKREEEGEGGARGCLSLGRGGGRGDEEGEFSLPMSLFELIRYAYACGSCRSRK